MRHDALPAVESIVLRGCGIVYVANPKVACTSLLRAFAGLDGFDEDQLRRSSAPEVTRALSIHDPDVRAAAGTDLRSLGEDELGGITADDGWLVLTAVRHPVPRLWSAWQTKLLLREPYYLAAFGGEPWFPRRPASSEAVAADFRRFVEALGDDPAVLAADVHWAPQHEVLRMRDIDYGHVGRLERLDATIEVVEDHLRSRGNVTAFRPEHENRTILPPPGEVLTPELVAQIEHVYAADLEAFGYDGGWTAPAPAPARGEAADADEGAVMAALTALVDRHERIGDMSAALLSGAAAHEAALQEVQAQHDATRADLDRARHVLGVVRGELDRAERAVDGLGAELAGIHGSRSFRAIHPLLRTYARARRVAGR